MEPWILRMCRDVSRRQVIAWASVFLVGVSVLVFNARYVKNFIGGPYALHSNDLAQIANPETTPRYFISTSGEKVFDTGIQEITTTTRSGVKEGSSVTAGYYAVLVGDRFLIVKSSTKPSSEVQGALRSIPTDLSSQLFSGTGGREIQNNSYPFYLESEGFRYPGYWGIGFLLIFLVLLWKYGRTAWVRLQDVNKHPVVRRLQSWGDPIAISFEAERELTSEVRYKSKGVFITDKYVIRKTFFAFNLLRFEDLLWVYKKVTRKSVNFIPTGKDYAAILIFYGGSQTFNASEAVIGEVLEFASGRAPWAVLGYSEEIKALFSKQTTEFCQAVEGRRRDVMSRKM
jgi:hypothetical protein